MIYLTKEDYFEVYLASMISTNDRDVLFMLYQPIIGHHATALYLSLYTEFKKQELSSLSSHQDLIETMDITLDELIESRRLLEGIGLLQTYYKKDQNGSYFKYVLFAPKTPSEFFSDVLLRGLLVRSIGEKKTNQISNIYKSKQLDLDGYNEITESFVNVFHPDFDSTDFYSSLDYDKSYKRKTKDISKGFDKGNFLKTIGTTHQIKPESFKDNDLDEIAKIALLYGVEEYVMADFVAQSIDFKGVIDFEKLKKLSLRDLSFSPVRTNNIKSSDIFDGDGIIAKKINLMSTTSAIDYLKIKQNNGALSPSDVKLIDDLANNFGLNSQVINPLIDYVLENYDNRLPRSLVLKIGATLSRNQIQSTVDAMNYLYKAKNYEKNTKKVQNSKEEKAVTQEDIASLLDEIGEN